MTFEMLNLNLGPWFKVSRLIKHLFDRSQGELEQKIRHHQLVTQVEETVLLLIFWKKPERIITGPFNAPVTVIIDQP